MTRRGGSIGTSRRHGSKPSNERPVLPVPVAAANGQPGRLLLLVLLVCAWAASWPVMKIGVASVGPLWFGSLRYLVASVLLLTIAAARGELAWPARQDRPLILISGATQMAGFSALSGAALTILPPGRAAVLAYSTPLWVAPLAAWRLAEPLSRRAILGLGLGLAGIALLVAPSLRTNRFPFIMADLMLLGAAGLWAISIVYVRTHRFIATPLALAPWQTLFATALLCPLAYLTAGAPPPIDRTAALTLAYAGPVATAFAYWAMVAIGRHFSATTISTALLITPSLGALFSAVILHEAIGATLIGGICLIGAGIMTVILAPRHAKSSPRRWQGHR